MKKSNQYFDQTVVTDSIPSHALCSESGDLLDILYKKTKQLHQLIS